MLFPTLAMPTLTAPLMNPGLDQPVHHHLMTTMSTMTMRALIPTRQPYRALIAAAPRLRVGHSPPVGITQAALVRHVANIVCVGNVLCPSAQKSPGQLIPLRAVLDTRAQNSVACKCLTAFLFRCASQT